MSGGLFGGFPGGGFQGRCPKNSLRVEWPGLVWGKFSGWGISREMSGNPLRENVQGFVWGKFSGVTGECSGGISRGGCSDRCAGL